MPLTILALVTESDPSLSSEDERIRIALFLLLLAWFEMGRDLLNVGLCLDPPKGC